MNLQTGIIIVFLDGILLFKINKQYAAPLFLAYDDRIKEKHDIIKTYEVTISI